MGSSNKDWNRSIAVATNSVNQGGGASYSKSGQPGKKNQLPQKPNGYKKWDLSEDGIVSARCGLFNNEVTLRISSEPVLTEDRPHSPSPFLYENDPKLK